MKSGILLFFVLVALGFGLSAQPLHWRESSPATFAPLTIASDLVKFSEGTKSTKITFTETGTPYFVSDTMKITAGASYNLAIDVLDNDPGTEVNTRLVFINAAGTGTNVSSTVYSSNNAAWQTLIMTGTAPAEAVKAYLVIRIYDVAASWTGSGTFNLDNAKFTQGTSTTNLFVNPGFEDWNIVPGSTALNWSESLFDPLKTSVIEADQKVKNEGLTSVKYRFTDPGTPYFLCDTFKVTPGAAYNFSIDYLDNDPAGVISARLWLIASPKTPYLTRTTTANTVDSPNWQTLTLTGTAPANATLAYVAIRMNPASAATFTSATFNADNARYTEGTSTTNLIKNGGFENWKAPSGGPEFATFKFEGLSPVVTGIINKTTNTIAVTVPYSTVVSALVPTFTLSDGATAKVGTTAQVSGTTVNDFTNTVTYTLTKGTTTQDWKVTVTKPAPTTGKDIISFKFGTLTPVVEGVVTASAKTVSLEVPTGTNVTALVPTITLSANAVVSPLSGVAQNFTTPKTYTVTAQDGSTQAWVVSVSFVAPGQTTLFSENFETLKVIPSTWVLKNNDAYTQAVGEERWQDSAWVVAASTRIELAGTKVAMASSFCSNMPLNGRADDWMILPAITLGGNSTLSWQAMSITSSGNYPDDYKVYIAPFTNGVTPSVPYFEENGNLLLSVAPENWSAGVGRPGAGLANRSVKLKTKITPDAPNGWFDRKVWIAFVLTTDLYTNPTTGIPNATAGGSNLAIDNIKVVNDLNTGIDETSMNSLDAAIFPNPATNQITLSVNLQVKENLNICVIDVTGREVMNINKDAVSGINKIKLDVSKLKRGIYTVRTRANQTTNVTRLMINN